MQHIIKMAEGAGMHLPYPTWVTGVVAIAIFIVLGVITWSYRDVANRHDHKSSNNSHH